ncbi:hypothetical protein B0H19DRAFT_1241893, partial [Mycena capillaripes]
MDDEPQFEPEFTTDLSLDDHGPLSHANFTNVNEAAPRDPFESPSQDQYTTSPFFSNSKHIVVMGGNFTNINHAAPSSPPGFRVIPLGDLNLLHEMKPSSGSAVVSR